LIKDSSVGIGTTRMAASAATLTAMAMGGCFRDGLNADGSGWADQLASSILLENQLNQRRCVLFAMSVSVDA